MLLEDDANLVRQDLSLPGLAVLLHPEAFAAVLSRKWPGVTWGLARGTYIRYKPSRSCLIAYQVQANGSWVDLYARAYRPTAQDKLGKARRRPYMPSPCGIGGGVLEDFGITVSFFPNDAKLRKIKRLANPHGTQSLLRRVMPDQPDLWRGTIRKLSYKPERRFVSQVVVDGQTRAVLKAYTDSDYAKLSGSADAFRSVGNLRLAKRLGGSDDRCVLLFEWMDGQSLRELISTEAEPPVHALQQVGSALAHLHAQTPQGLPSRTRPAEATNLMEAASTVAMACPSLGQRVQSLAQRIADFLNQQPAIALPVHGNFDAKQVLIDEDHVTVLDLDKAVLGDPAADLGNFIAHLDQGTLRGDFPASHVLPLAHGFLDGYRAAGGSVEVLTRVELYRAASLLHLSPYCFRHREPAWVQRTHDIVEWTEQVLNSAIPNAFRPCSIVPRSPRNPRNQPNPAGDGTLRRLHRHRSSSIAIPVIDPWAVCQDPKMPFLAKALDPDHIQQRLRALPPSRGLKHPEQLRLRAIRVTRHKPGRRCLIEYDTDLTLPDESTQMISFVGKARARGLDRRTFDLYTDLVNHGFDSDSADGVSVPEPIGMMPECHMWLQRKVPGIAVAHLLNGRTGVDLAERVAEAIHKLHQLNLAPRKQHAINDELRVLHDRLPEVAERMPQFKHRLERILQQCDQLGERVRHRPLRAIHRDFYQDQVIVSGQRVFLVDLDMYCQGDPALDIGNFIGHLTELAVREHGDPRTLWGREQALEQRYLQLNGPADKTPIRIYTTLTLVRHIYLSTQFPQRHHSTEPLMVLCEERLSQDLGTPSLPTQGPASDPATNPLAQANG